MTDLKIVIAIVENSLIGKGMIGFVMKQIWWNSVEHQNYVCEVIDEELK